MKKVKSFIVEGNTVTHNGKKEKDIAKNVDLEVNKFLVNLEGELIDIKITPVFQGATGDYAFVTVIYDGKETREEKAAKEAAIKLQKEEDARAEKEREAAEKEAKESAHKWKK